MHIREATPGDYHAMGLIQADCNLTDSLARFFIRDMEKYPTTYRKSSTRVVKRRACSTGAVSFVVETDPPDYALEQQQNKAPEIAGFAIWFRKGTSDKAKKWAKTNAGWFASFNRTLDSVEDRYVRTFTNVDCTFDGRKFAQVIPYLIEAPDREIFDEFWELELFFVHPDWQRRGLGRKMMQWGLDRATEEGVPVVVKSSALGAPAYKAMGFRSISESKIKTLFDAKVFGGEDIQTLIWEPKDLEGQWYDRAVEAAAKADQGVTDTSTA